MHGGESPMQSAAFGSMQGRRRLLSARPPPSAQCGRRLLLNAAADVSSMQGRPHSAGPLALSAGPSGQWQGRREVKAGQAAAQRRQQVTAVIFEIWAQGPGLAQHCG